MSSKTLTGRQLCLPIAASQLGSTSRAVQPIPLQCAGFSGTHLVGRNRAILKWVLWVVGIPGGEEGLVSSLDVVTTRTTDFFVFGLGLQLANSHLSVSGGGAWRYPDTWLPAGLRRGLACGRLDATTLDSAGQSGARLWWGADSYVLNHMWSSAPRS
jgi:hypothetical protein